MSLTLPQPEQNKTKENKPPKTKDNTLFLHGLKIEVYHASLHTVPFKRTITMASHTVSKSEQYIVGTEDYFRFPSPPAPNGNHRVLWTSAPKNLRKCPRVELNRLTRLLESKGLALPMTLRYIKKAELLALIEPLLQFE